MSILIESLSIPLNKIPTILDQLCLIVIRGIKMNHNIQIIFQIYLKNDLLVTKIPCKHKVTIDGSEFSHIFGCTIQILKEKRHSSVFILTKNTIRVNLLTKIFLYFCSSTGFSKVKTLS
ncbi:hypothetical protein T459_04942 [Capsicum annuum]|uniref:Uncharacterized protein n=1 Tax=Capsicum annuum TaxID=4072 RepID=A0A2G3A6E6_CAPAN|nr:hypothetical protein T459_04942 [Capsicum annuum]